MGEWVVRGQGLWFFPAPVEFLDVVNAYNWYGLNRFVKSVDATRARHGSTGSGCPRA